MNDREAIRDLIERWALWRDGGDFDRLLTCWHVPGMMATTYGEFDAVGSSPHRGRHERAG